MSKVNALCNIEIGIDGLTCSQCSQSVSIQLKKLPFLSSIEMQLDSAVAIAAIKHEAAFNIQKVITAVERAGFSVRYIKLCPGEAIGIDDKGIWYIGNAGFLLSNVEEIDAKDCFIIKKEHLKPANKVRPKNNKILIYETEISK